MGKRDKKLDKWRNNTPKEVPVAEVQAIVDYFFPSSQLPKKKGSHNIVIRDDRLVGFREFGPLGHLEIPVKGGQKVKGWYLIDLVKAIDIIKESSETEE